LADAASARKCLTGESCISLARTGRGLLSFQEQDRSGRRARSADGRVAQKRLNLDELNRIARKLRVQRVMQPYLETVVM
jgi:hypothetical protein